MERGLTASREDGGSDSAAGESGIARDILVGGLNIWIVVVGAQRIDLLEPSRRVSSVVV